MYSSQSSPRYCGTQADSCGDYKSARRAAKKAKFDAWMRRKAKRHGYYHQGHFAPAVNVIEQDDRYEIQVFAPGFQKEDFELSLTDNILSIAGKTSKKDSDTFNFSRKEFSVRDFERKFELNDRIDSDEIKAEYKEGILTVTLKVKPGEERTRHSITVE